MQDKTKYTIAGLFIFLVGILLGYASGSTTGMYLQTSPTEPIKCTDTDPKNDIYTYGVVTLNERVYPDRCVSSILYESYCGERGDVGALRQNCNNGCLNGACIR